MLLRTLCVCGSPFKPKNLHALIITVDGAARILDDGNLPAGTGEHRNRFVHIHRLADFRIHDGWYCRDLGFMPFAMMKFAMSKS